MMFMPDIRKEFDLFDEISRDWDMPVHWNQNMNTDIVEEDGNYVITTDLPGYEKEDIQVSLQDGSLTISAHHDSNNEEKNDQGKVIRSERFHGSYQRTFYVGDEIKEEDIKASYKNGILKLVIPKVDDSNEVETVHRIAIE